MKIRHRSSNEICIVNGKMLKVMCWNIQGLSNNVISDDYFKQRIYKHDIVVLTETWLTDHIELYSDEYYNYHCIRPVHTRARRPSGGITILLRHNLRAIGNTKITTIVKETEFCIWCKLDKHHFNTPTDIYICAIYIPPQYSTFWNNHAFDPFEMLEQDILQFQNKGEVLLLGDFNARTGDKPDFVTDVELDDYDNCMTNSENILDKYGRKNRNNDDNVVNAFGKKLLMLCKEGVMLV